jgi:glucose dehydrogenase
MNAAVELLADTLRAEHNGVDLQQDDQLNLIVCAQQKDGTLYELGRVSGAMVYQNPEAAHMAIGRIKFRARLAQPPQRSEVKP